MKTHPSRETSLKPSEIMRTFSCQAKGIQELVIDGFNAACDCVFDVDKISAFSRNTCLKRPVGSRFRTDFLCEEKAQMVLEAPLQLFFLLWLKRVAHDNGILRPIIDCSTVTLEKNRSVMKEGERLK